ncbi:MAG TPA: fibronectin type III domain-containing protein [Bdellovibrionota bacterium]|nr:fibronectin type III domain-containing protein [Bdellovibrionota bacterium]
MTLLVTFCSLLITGCKRLESTRSAQSETADQRGTVTLNWDAPLTNTDDTPLNDLTGHRIRYGLISGVYSTSLDIGLATTYTISNLSRGKNYYFVVSSINSSGEESDLSNEVAKIAP